jgi:hypothetical protein
MSVLTETVDLATDDGRTMRGMSLAPRGRVPSRA